MSTCTPLLLSPQAGTSPCPHPSIAAIIAARVQASLSGCWRGACLGDVHLAYLISTILAALLNGYAAYMNFTGAESVEVVAERIGVSQRWMLPFGTMLAAGAVGLLTGLAVPAVGTAAAIGLVAYFICAVSAHLRVHDHGIGGAVFFLLLAAAALTTSIANHNHW